VDLLSPTDTLPGFAGYTSQAHPWSSGASAWASANVAGVRPLSPGFSTYTVAPHLGGGMRGVSARLKYYSDTLCSCVSSFLMQALQRAC
jgi:hypothetical protein